MRDDGRRDLARQIPIKDVADRLGIAGLRRNGTEWMGPCPVCGGRDRFGLNPARQVFLCRQCPDGKGDGIALVQHTLGCDFKAALDWLVGDAEAQVDPAEIERRRRAAAEAERKRRDTEARMRARAIRDAREIWHLAEIFDTAPAAAYLAGRGIRFATWPPTLRFLPDHAYRRTLGGTLREWHSGPCMIAAIQGPGGRVTAVHQTWIDPDRPGAKAEIRGPDGEAMPAKMVRGSKKGGAIRLTRKPDRGGTLVMGEGIETTASAMMVSRGMGGAFWAGVDLGNMAGRQVKVPGTRHSGMPDLEDADAFLPPPGLGRLIFLQDGDSDPEATRAKLLAGLRRAQHHTPSLAAQIVAAPEGKDFNDMIRGGIEHD